LSVHKILVGVDDSEGSRRALQWAADLAADLKAKLVVAHVFEPLAHLGELAPGADLRALRERTAQTVEEIVCRPLRERGLAYETRVLEGLPAEALADAADLVQADLIVVGARRRGLLKGLVLGSTSRELAQLTPRPVTIIHLEPSAGGRPGKAP
jgi:nucleotide-binding universal stress UspA family protein